MLTVGSMFSGIGGIELGLERGIGARPVWFCENNQYSQEILKKNWNGVTIYDDITTTRWEEVERPDIITAGFPCQDISNAGKREGIKGARSGLFFSLWEAVRILRPKLVILENVAALTHRGLSEVLGEIAESGYDAEWDCIPAAAVGAPHRRDRIFIVCYPNSNRCEPHASDEIEEGCQARVRVGSQHQSRTADRQLPDAVFPRLEGTRQPIELAEFRERSQQNHWAIEPDVGRVAHGIPDRVDRIKCLGNAVVPQVAEYVGERIKMTLAESRGAAEGKER